MKSKINKRSKEKSELENLDKPVYVTKDAIMMDILKQNFINKNFGDGFNYVGLLDSTVAFEPEDE